MSEPELTFADIARRLPANAPALQPPPDLWQRIVAEHERRVVRRHRRRFLAASAVAAGVVLVLFGAMTLQPERPAGIDWQARAQALELQVRALQAAAPVQGASGGVAQSELAQLDRALQAAYDDGAEAARVDALWKRRSELLEALLRARRENLEISRI